MNNVPDLYRSIKQILDNSNLSLTNRGLDNVISLKGVADEIAKLGIINRLPYLLRKEIIEVTKDDLSGATNIPISAFENCKNLTTVTMPDSVTDIGSFAFGSCYNLTNITISNSLTSIGPYAFHYCTSLENVTIPNSVTNIDNSAFYYCYNLTSIVIPNSVNSIGGHAFYNCGNLDNVYMYSITPPTLGNTNAIPNDTLIHVPVGGGDAYKSATNWSYYSDRIVEDIVIE